MTEEKNINPQGVIDKDITEVMKSGYINYAMNVIVARALPDVRDGLKPVHRRVLYAMKELGLAGNNVSKKKSARIVGDIIGKYHPHGDSAAYEAMVRMAQDFSYRYPLVEGQGNFGSIDGDPAAAMRYTEAKLSPISEQLLREIDKNTVDFIDNYDGSEKEPLLVPSRFPHLLTNGATGIAVGMATNIPPHHLGEVVDTAVALIDNVNITDDELLSYIQGPDFPTGGTIIGREEIRKAYLTGRGKLTLRGRLTIEEGNGGKPEVIINDIPYGVKKPNLIEKIAELVRAGKIEDIVDIRDESDRNGLRIAIELKKGAVPQKIVKQLYKLTDLQTSFGIINLAIVDGTPQELSLREILTHYIVFQRDVIERRTRYDLEKSLKRAHILEGLVIVGSNIDEVVQAIRSSRNPDTARNKLMKQFKLSEEQAQAVLDLRLQRITGLEVNKTKNELKEVQKVIAEFERILSNVHNIDEVIKKELLEIKEKYSDERRTLILANEQEQDEMLEGVIKKTLVVAISNKGYVHTVDEALYTRQTRGGKGTSAFQTAADDFIEHIFTCTTDQILGLFTEEGQFFRIPVNDLTENAKNQRGTLAYNLVSMNSETKVASYLVFNPEDDNKNLYFFSKDGFIKKMSSGEILNSRNGILSIKLRKDDKLLSVFAGEENEEFIVATKKGKCIRFDTSDVRPMGRVASGVTTINLDKEDHIVGVDLIKNGDFVIILSDLAHGKRTSIEEFRLQKRGGKGVRIATFTKKHGSLIGIELANEDQDVLLTTNSGKSVRLHVKDFAIMTRDTSGGKVIELNEGDFITGFTVISGTEEE